MPTSPSLAKSAEKPAQRYKEAVFGEAMERSSCSSRIASVFAWKQGSRADLLGTGKYGKVFRVKGPSDSVVKESVVRSPKDGPRRQAFREHVIGLLQTLLVLRRHTPHVPVHFATSIGLDAKRALQGHMYMEAFDGSLQDCGAGVLRGAGEWLSLAFQVSSALVVLADMLHITHNDLYPRNVLVRARACVGSPVLYSLAGRRYLLRWPFLAVLTDFGIASSELLMGQDGAPEVAASLPDTPVPAAFGEARGGVHILRYKELPTFSRDAYTLLRWMRHGAKGMPAPPEPVVTWAAMGLRAVDSHRQIFKSPRGLVVLFHSLFDASTLCSCGLAGPLLPREPAADDTGPEEMYSYHATEEERDAVLSRAEDLLRQLPFCARSEHACGEAFTMKETTRPDAP